MVNIMEKIFPKTQSLSSEYIDMNRHGFYNGDNYIFHKELNLIKDRKLHTGCSLVILKMI